MLRVIDSRANVVCRPRDAGKAQSFTAVGAVWANPKVPNAFSILCLFPEPVLFRVLTCPGSPTQKETCSEGPCT